MSSELSFALWERALSGYRAMLLRVPETPRYHLLAFFFWPSLSVYQGLNSLELFIVISPFKKGGQGCECFTK